MGDDWKTERDSLLRETLAYVRAINSQKLVVTCPVLAAPHALDDAQGTPSPLPERAQPTFHETVESRGLEPVKWEGMDREEIAQRVAAFKAHQKRFSREREEYALSMLVRMKASLGRK